MKQVMKRWQDEVASLPNLPDRLLTSIPWMISQSILQPRDCMSGHPHHPDNPHHLILVMLFSTLLLLALAYTSSSSFTILEQASSHNVGHVLPTTADAQERSALTFTVAQVLHPQPSHDLFHSTTILFLFMVMSNMCACQNHLSSLVPKYVHR